MKRGEIIISREELRALPEYSCSLPTGTTIGKRWRRDLHAYRPRPRREPEWVIGEYYDVGSKTEIGIRWFWALSAPGIVHRGALEENRL